MFTKNTQALLKKLNSHTYVLMEAAYGYANSRTHHTVEPEHLLYKLLEEGNGDIPLVLKRWDIDIQEAQKRILEELEDYHVGNTGKARPSEALGDMIENSWLISTIHLNSNEIRSASFLEYFLASDTNRIKYSAFRALLEPVSLDELHAKFSEIVDGSVEDSAGSDGTEQDRQYARATSDAESGLDRFTENLTAKAREGKIDPVFGRDQEIRQMIDILCRRRKNNPILVGEAGVGKTAVVEGFALKIANGEVLDSLKNVDIRSLDLGGLQAGASVKGEFEKRLKSVITGVVNAPVQTILFIDEAHTLIGAGGAPGSGDAANLLKPALARGKLRTIAATTWSEYKKYIEKDPALERRFQTIKIDEPDVPRATIMLRGIRGLYEKHHGVTISDEAIEAAASLSGRYIVGRQLPDKAVDLLDTASARVRMAASSKPGQLEFLQRHSQHLMQQKESIERDVQQGLFPDISALDDVKQNLETTQNDIDKLSARWKKESVCAKEIVALKQQLEELSNNGSNESALKSARDKIRVARKELKELQGDDPLAFTEVTSGVIASVVSDWTGIPVGKMVRDQAKTLLNFEKLIGERIIGQSYALKELATTIRVNKSGMGKPDQPIGVFLLVGPSGTGKTETARATADLLFGGEKFTTVINMSEYQEKHTVSQLKGSPPGYVGYGEGGVLTEAVRRRPYSVVLLDEIEKADPEVMNLFFQVFDKGIMRDGEGREIDFKNTVIMMTSNVASDLLIELGMQETPISAEELVPMVTQELSRTFPPALLARMKVVPFMPLKKDSITAIVLLKLEILKQRLQDNHGIAMTFDDTIIDDLAEQCTDVQSGARNVDLIIERKLLPEVSCALVERLSSETPTSTLELSLNADGSVSFTFA